MNTPVLELYQIERYYQQGDVRLHILHRACLTLYPGESVALIAPSGTGKSTLLHIAGLLETPNGGDILLGDVAAMSLSDKERTVLRRKEIGYIYQFHHLLPDFSALENVMLPQMIAGYSSKEARARAEELLTYLGLGGRLRHIPGQLSGGEQQRVAIARAIANGPRLLLADEPTGNLDPTTAARIFAILLSIAKATQLATLIATHNMELAMRMDRRVTLQEGQIVEL